MKNAIMLIVLALFATSVHSQSLTQKDLTGTWLVANVENSSSNPKMAAAMQNAVINLYADNSFEIKEKQADGTYSYKTTTNKTSHSSNHH